MSNHVQWIEYKGKKILFSNYAGLKGDELLEANEATRQALLKLPDGSRYLSLTDVSNLNMSMAMTAKGREVMALVKKKDLSGPSAIVGVTELMASIAKLLVPNMHFAKTVEEAKEWLVAQEK